MGNQLVNHWEKSSVELGAKVAPDHALHLRIPVYLVDI